jgi:acylglycerol lipase
MPKLRKIGIYSLAIVAAGTLAAVFLGSQPSTGPCSNTAQAGDSPNLNRFRFNGTDGNCFQAYEWKQVGKPVIAVAILIHGIHDHARRYDQFALALNANGIAVYIMDHRGHGLSGGARQRVDSAMQLVGDVDLLVLEAIKRNGGVPLFLHGHSMGGMIAAHYAARNMRPLNGVVLSSAALKLPATASSGARTIVGVLSKIAPELALEPVDENLIVRDPAARKTLLGGIVEIQTRMESITAPLLILHGTSDKVTEVDGSREMFARARSKDKVLKLYNGAFHDLLNEPEGAEVIREIVTFFETHAHIKTGR